MRRIVLLGASIVCFIAATDTSFSAPTELMKCLEGKEPAARVDACNRVVQSRPARATVVRARTARGLVYLGLGKPDEALADFNEVIRLSPKVAAHYDNRQAAHRAKGNLAAALEDANRAVELAPTRAFVHHSRGVVHSAMDAFSEALRDFDKSIEIDPKPAFRYHDRGKVRAALGRFEEAIADFDRASEINPKFHSALLERAKAKAQLGLAEAALADVTEYLTHNPEDTTARLLVAEFERSSAGAQNTAQVPLATDESIPTQTRKALVIGIAAYESVPKLPNPINDATDIAAKLRTLGFSVREALDLSYDQFRIVLRDFSQDVTDADLGVVFFAGHGIEIGGQNYLIPVDARLRADRDVPFEAIPLDLVISSVEHGKGARLVLLDACRDNPFRARMTLANTSRSVSRGLSRVDPTGGVLVGFAAKEGTTARDGDGRNSPYSTALLEYLDRPGLELRLLLGKVRDRVLDITGRMQEPFVYGALGGDEVYLASPHILEGRDASTAKSIPVAAGRSELDLAVAKLRSEMPYEAARRVLVESGWQPVRFPWQTMEERCGSREVCQKYAEAEACSGTGMGYCRFEYGDANGRKLSLVTIGEELESLVLENWWITE